MSHKHHTPHTRGVMHDIKVRSPQELSIEYGIEIDEKTKSVWDPIEGIQFDTLLDWAAYMKEQEEDAYDQHFERIGHKHVFDDY